MLRQQRLQIGSAPQFPELPRPGVPLGWTKTDR
jgi:hypothetical protein